MHDICDNTYFIERIKGDEALHAGRQEHGVHITAPKARALEIRRETVDIGKQGRTLDPVTEMNRGIIVAERCSVVLEILVAVVAFGWYHIYFLISRNTFYMQGNKMSRQMSQIITVIYFR